MEGEDNIYGSFSPEFERNHIQFNNQPILHADFGGGDVTDDDDDLMEESKEYDYCSQQSNDKDMMDFHHGQSHKMTDVTDSPGISGKN